MLLKYKKNIKDDAVGRTVIEHSKDLIGVLDFSLGAKYLFVNPSYKTTLGYELNELIGTKSLDLVHPDDKKKIQELIGKYLKQRLQNIFKNKDFEVHENIEVRYKHKSGHYVLLEINADAINDKIVIISRDISERRKIENELRASGERLNILFKKAPDAVFINDFSGFLLDVNNAAVNLTGIKAADLLGSKLSGLGVFDEAGVVILEKAFVSNEKGNIVGPFEMTVTKKDGSKEIVEIIAYPIDDERESLSIVTARIVSYKHAIKRKLKAERDKFQKYLDIAGVILLALDNEGHILLINKKGRDLLGYHEDELLGRNWMDKVVKESDRAKLIMIHKELLDGSEGRNTFENIVLTKDGGEKRIFWNNALMKNNKGEVVGTISSGEDVGYKEVTEEQARQAADEWAETFDAMSDGVFIQKDDFTILRANKVVCDMWGVNKEAAIGKKCYEVFHNTDKPIESCPLLIAIQTGEKQVTEYYEKKVGKWLSLTVSSIKKQGSATKYIHIVRDISHKKEAEIELQERNEGLESFNKIAVGRELKMIELKEQIKILEKKCSNQ